MHYIRILKPPRVLQGAGSQTVLSAKITVTTDLGEAFLRDDIRVVVGLENEVGAELGEMGKGREYTWKGREGMRSLEVSIPVPASAVKGKPKVRMVVRAKDSSSSRDTFESVLQHGDGGVVAVRSLPVDLRPGATQQQGMAERIFSSLDGEKEVHIWEETGESIARHIWDAGLILSSYLTTLSSLPTKRAQPLPSLPALETLLSRPNLKVLELGAGCGIVGISLATFFPKISKITLTDLPEASEILSHNLSLFPSSRPSKPKPQPQLTHEILDWSLPLPSSISSTKWDLVLVADCTYNPDVVPALVKTLRRVVDGGGSGESETMVLLAMKVRHESEMVFFDLMDRNGFTITEKIILPLPVLGGVGDEEIEVFIFQLGEKRKK